MESHSEPKQQKNTVDYDNVILALPAQFPTLGKTKAPRAGIKGATSSKGTPTGQRKNSKDASRDAVTEDQRKNIGAATGDAVTIGSSGFTKNPDNVNNEHTFQEEYTGIVEQQNLTNTEEILEESTDLTKEPNVANIENLVLEESGQQNLTKAKEDILAEDPAGFAEAPDAVSNEQQILVEQAGLVQQQNPPNSAQAEIQEKDLASFAEEPNAVNDNDQPILEKQAGLVEQQNLVNTAQTEIQEEDPAGVMQQQIPENGSQGEMQQEGPAGLLQQQDHVNAAQGEMQEEDPAVLDDIVEYPLRNPIVEDYDDIIKDLDDNY